MPVKDTSKLAHKEIKQDGTAMSQKETVYAVISTQGNITRSEISHISGIRINAVCGRVNDLIHENRVKELQRRKCKLTGRKAHPVTVVPDNSAF